MYYSSLLYESYILEPFICKLNRINIMINESDY